MVRFTLWRRRGATVTLDASPMTRFNARGATFVTSGSGFEISGAPLPLLEELNPAYAGLFTSFSAPRIVAMDDFVFGEPVATAGLVVTPGAARSSAPPASTWSSASTPPTGGRILFDGTDVTPYMVGGLQRGRLTEP